jgi:methylenetetrahydrofolate reductase (NADPH)
MGRYERAFAVAGGNATPLCDKHAIVDFLTGYSVETSPAAADRLDSFRDHLSPGTRVYIATLPGTGFEQVISTARRLRDEGMIPVPHLPARGIGGPDQLDRLLGAMSREAGVEEVLAIAGGLRSPVGAFDRTMQMLETGLFQRHGIRRIGVAGHPEGNPDIDSDELGRALAEKNAFAEQSGIALYLVTQFCFDPKPVIAWDRAIRQAGNRLPIHIGIAGPATLKSLLNYARMCGIGPSARVLLRQGRSLARLGTVSAPDQLVAGLARYRASDPQCGIESAHFYTFGGLRRATRWLDAVLKGDFDMRVDREGFIARGDL